MAKDTVGTQLSLFGDLFDEQPIPAEKPVPAAKAPAARWAELNGILNQAAYAYYALDAPEMTDAEFEKTATLRAKAATLSAELKGEDTVDISKPDGNAGEEEEPEP